MVWLFSFFCWLTGGLHPFFSLVYFLIAAYLFLHTFFVMSYFSRHFTVAFLLEENTTTEPGLSVIVILLPKSHNNKTHSVEPAQNAVLFHLDVAAICSGCARWAGMWQMWKERQQCSVCTENITACCSDLLSPQRWGGPEEPKY